MCITIESTPKTPAPTNAHDQMRPFGDATASHIREVGKPGSGRPGTPVPRAKNAIQGAEGAQVSAFDRIHSMRPISFYASGRGFVIRCHLANNCVACSSVAQR